MNCSDDSKGPLHTQGKDRCFGLISQAIAGLFGRPHPHVYRVHCFILSFLMLYSMIKIHCNHVVMFS
jgi:hypothetical protein